MTKEQWVDYIYDRTGIDKAILSQEYDQNYKPNQVKIYNSVTGGTHELEADEFMSDLKEKQIIVENGVLFLNHDQKTAVAVKSISALTSARSGYKQLMIKSKEVKDFVGSRVYNGAQLDTKGCINTYYGIQLNIFSKFYNYHVASSITARGRGTVSLNGLTLEFSMGSWRPYRVTALLDFMTNAAAKEVPSYILDSAPLPKDDDIVRHLLKDRYDTYYAKDILYERLRSYNDNQKKCIYYTGNFDAFVEIPRVTELLTELVKEQNEAILNIKGINEKEYKKFIYLDPMSPPENLKGIIDQYNEYLYTLLFGFYWYEGDTLENGERFDSPEDIFRHIKRESVILTDTDSLIITLNPGIIKLSKITNIDMIAPNIPLDFRDFILGSIIINTTSLMVSHGLKRYTKQSYIPEAWRKVISYKQEFFFRTLQTTLGAKNYLAVISVQEGAYLPVEEVELKGLSLKKSNFNSFLSEKARYIAIDLIAKQSTPDIKQIMGEIAHARKEIPQMLRMKDNLDVFTASKLNKSYDDPPLSDYRYKAVDLYNKLFDAQINLPGYFLIAQIDLTDEEEDLEENYPDLYKKLLKIMDERTITYSLLSISNRVTRMWGDNPPEAIIDIVNDLKEIQDVTEFKKYITDTKKAYKNLEVEDDIRDFVNRISTKITTLKDINKIAIPLDSEFVPEFISEHIDINDVAVFENLISVVVQGLGLIVVRNNKNRQIITHVLNYY